MHHLVSTIAAILYLAITGSGYAQSNQAGEQRIALVIGNSAYKEGPLRNPANDATDVAAALKGLGFNVLLRTNANRRQMVEAVREFGNQIKRGGVGFFYYAGHGVQSKGKNFLIPVGVQIEAESDLEFETMDANMVLAQMDDAGNRVNIVVLDACRDNPFARSFRSASRGLAQLDSAKGSFLAYATSPGSVASDGSGRNGTYTKHLLASLKQPDTKLEEVFKRVRVEVAKETGNKQIPWDSSSLLGDFYFRSPVQVANIATQPPIAIPADPSANDRALWDAIKDTKNPDEIRAYLSQFPSGLFAGVAQARLKSLESTQVATAAPNIAATRPLGDAEAQQLYRRATEQNDARAQVNLGVMYETGRGGLAKDDVEAVRWYRLAVAQNYAQAQSLLGVMYVTGRGGLAKDDVEALRWFRLSAAQNNEQAQSNLGVMYATGRGGLVKDDVEAVRWYRLAAEQNYARGQVNLGFMYANGRGGLGKDLNQAIEWYRKAAAQGDTTAKANLTRLGAN